MALTDTFTRNIKHSGRPAGDKHSGGDVLTEAAAILTWLGAAHGKEGYARDTVLGRKEAEALSYMTSEVHATYGGHFSPGNFAETEAAQQEVKRKTYENLAGQYQRMNDVLSGNGGAWYLGERTFADTFLYVLARWIEQTPLSIDKYPALKQHRARMQADQGVQLALKRQDMKPIG
ncbi:MAG: glutathione S-transferase family protein, partial [Rhodoferax sp.]